MSHWADMLLCFNLIVCLCITTIKAHGINNTAPTPPISPILPNAVQVVCRPLNRTRVRHTDLYVDRYEPFSFIKCLQFSCMVRSFSEETPQMRMNQFPCESVVTVRDLLVQVARRKSAGRPDPATLNTTPKWLPTTYNLKTELSKFVSYYQQRLKKYVNILLHLFLTSSPCLLGEI